MSLIDIVPTLLDLIGKEIPRNLHGISLKNALIDCEKLQREKVFVECANGEIGVRTVDYLFSILTEWDKDDESKREIIND